MAVSRRSRRAVARRSEHSEAAPAPAEGLPALQRAYRAALAAPAPDNLRALQRTLGNQAVGQMLGRRSAPTGAPIQRIMSVADFQQRTPAKTFKPRKTIRTIDTALADYIGSNNKHKLARLNDLMLAINTYLTSDNHDEERLQVVRVLEQQADQEPVTAAYMAAALDLTVEAFYQRLEEGLIPLEDYFGANVTQKIPQVYRNRSIPDAVPRSIIAELEGNDNQKLGEIFNRINQFPFNYTGVALSPAGGFMTQAGDCRTLAGMFQLAAQAAGINGVEIRALETPHLVGTRAAHGRDGNGNVEGNTHWAFDNHFWCEAGGGRFDLLFMTQNAVPADLKTEQETYRGCSYTVYQSGACMIDRREAKQQLRVDLAGQGIVKPAKAEIRLYIDRALDG